MTVTSGFFNSVNHDRKYNAEEISSIFDGIILDGVYQGFGEALKVEGTSVANQVKIGSGRAWFNHTWTLNDEALYLTLPAPNSTYPRIDAIVLEVNNSSSVRANTIKYVSGSAASSPAKPSLTNTTDVHQYPLAYITRAAGSSNTITAGNIENKIGTSDCPIVTGVLEVLDDDRFIAQTIYNLNKNFNEWFDGIKGLLDDDAATNLANKILELTRKVDYNTSQLQMLDSMITTLKKGKNLGTQITDEQSRLIQNGTDGFSIGDYWVINGTTYVIAGRNTFSNETNTDVNCDTDVHNHLLIVPLRVYDIGTITLNYLPFDTPIRDKDTKYKNVIWFFTINDSSFYGYRTFIPCMEDFIPENVVLSNIYNDIPKNKIKSFPMLTNNGVNNVKYSSFKWFPIHIPTNSLYKTTSYIQQYGASSGSKGIIFFDTMDSGFSVSNNVCYVKTFNSASWTGALDKELGTSWQEMLFNHYDNNKLYAIKRLRTLLSSASSDTFSSNDVVNYSLFSNNRAYANLLSIGKSSSDVNTGLPWGTNKLAIANKFYSKKTYIIPNGASYSYSTTPGSSIKFYWTDYLQNNNGIYEGIGNNAGRTMISYLAASKILTNTVMYTSSNEKTTDLNTVHHITQNFNDGRYVIPFIVI